MNAIEALIAAVVSGIRAVGSLFGSNCSAVYHDEDNFSIDLRSGCLYTMDGKEELFAPTVSSPTGLHMLYMGTNSLLISDCKTNLIIDPYFTRPEVKNWKMPLCETIEIEPRPKMINKILEGAKIESLDAVLVTHAHFDHALDIAEVIKQMNSLKKNAPRLYGSSSTACVGKGGGVPDDQIIVIEESRDYKIGDFTVQFILSKHMKVPVVGPRLMGTIADPITPPADLFSYKDGGTYAIYIKHAKGNILNVGSANYKDKAFGHLRNLVDHLILGIAGFDKGVVAAFDHPTYKSDFYHETVEATSPGQIYFSHYDDFNQPLNNVTSCKGEPTKSYDYFVEKNENLKPLFLPIGGYVQL